MRKIKEIFPQLFTKEYKYMSIHINKDTPLLQKIAYVFIKLHYIKEMFRLRNHWWTCPKCGSKGRIVGYQCQLTMFKCEKCENEFEIEGY
jgi:hypothetical protein